MTIFSLSILRPISEQVSSKCGKLLKLKDSHLVLTPFQIVSFFRTLLQQKDLRSKLTVLADCDDLKSLIINN